MRRAISVKPLINYLLLVNFDNGEERVFNCFPLLKDKYYSQLFDIDFFNTVHIDSMGIVCWDDSLDINPYVLYDESEATDKFRFAV